jgi:hypothetical protein
LHPALVRWSGMRVAVRLAVGGVELLDIPTVPGPRGDYPPLLDLATWGLERFRALTDQATLRYDCGPSGPFLHFTRSGPRVRVASSLTRATGETNYADLLDVWQTFSEHVRSYLRHAAPDLQTNPFWHAWLAGADYAALQLPAAARVASARLTFAPGDITPQARELDLRGTPLAALAYTQFELPIQLQLGSADLFAAQATPPMHLPALDFAVRGLGQLELCASQGRSVYRLPSSSHYVRFELTAGGDALVHYSAFARVAQVPFDTLHAAWRTFATDVGTYLLEQAPELRDNPEWHSWLCQPSS